MGSGRDPSAGDSQLAGHLTGDAVGVLRPTPDTLGLVRPVLAHQIIERGEQSGNSGVARWRLRWRDSFRHLPVVHRSRPAVEAATAAPPTDHARLPGGGQRRVLPRRPVHRPQRARRHRPRPPRCSCRGNLIETVSSGVPGESTESAARGGSWVASGGSAWPPRGVLTCRGGGFDLGEAHVCASADVREHARAAPSIRDITQRVRSHGVRASITRMGDIWRCRLCGADLSVGVSCVRGVRRGVVPFGSESGVEANSATCRDCGVHRGGVHHLGCAVAWCAVHNEQRLRCGCDREIAPLNNYG